MSHTFQFEWSSGGERHMMSLEGKIGMFSDDWVVAVDEQQLETFRLKGVAGKTVQRRFTRGPEVYDVEIVYSVWTGEPKSLRLSVNGVLIPPFELGQEPVEVPQKESPAAPASAQATPPQEEPAAAAPPKEVIKIRCPYCRTLNDDQDEKCRNCSATL